MMHRPAPGLLLVLALSLSACGSTVAPSGAGAPVTAGGGADGQQTVDGLGVPVDVDPGAAGSTGAPGAAAVSGAEGTGTVAGGTAAGGSGTDTDSGTPTSVSAAGAAAPGGTITLGITYPDTAALASIFGRDSSQADPQAWMQKFVDYINRTGGVSGRKLKAVYFSADVADDQSTLGQRACTTFTQDTKVDIVLNTGILGDTFPACLGRAGISMVDNGVFMTDATDMRRVPNKLMPVAMRADRLYKAIVDVSGKRGLLPKGAVLGVVVEDCPWGNRVFQQHVQPAAQRLGVSIVKGTHRCVQNLVQDLGPVTNDVQRETLRFATEGVTHVMFVSTPEAFVVSRFTEQASDQRYFPKYLLSSNSYPYNGSNPDGIIKISSDALPNVSGLGFLPMLDVGELARPDGAGQKGAQDRCRKADPSEGPVAIEENGRAKYFNRNSFYAYCDAFFVIKALLEANGVRFGPADVTRGYQAALSGGLPSATLAGGSFRVTQDRLDGGGLVRPFAYDDGRKLFAYTGDPIPVP